MHDFPHTYRVSTRVENRLGDVIVSSPGLPDLATAAPAEFDGPGNRWSPETLLTAAVCDCFVLGFRAIAAASKLEWQRLEVEVDGVLERVERRMLFTEMRLRARLTVPAGQEGKAPRLLDKAEEACLVTNSLSAKVQYTGEVVVG
jgi:organic hydroperoxide reductase OsmC/OhrA